MLSILISFKVINLSRAHQLPSLSSIQPWGAPAREEWKEGGSSWGFYCSGYFPDWSEETGDVLQRYWLFISTELTAFSLYDSFISYCGNHCSLSLLGAQGDNSSPLGYRSSLVLLLYLDITWQSVPLIDLHKLF